MTLTLSWITLFMEDMGEGALHREERKQLSNKEINIWSWTPLDARHQDELAD
jgi:hypothetical protein